MLWTSRVSDTADVCGERYNAARTEAFRFCSAGVPRPIRVTPARIALRDALRSCGCVPSSAIARAGSCWQSVSPGPSGRRMCPDCSRRTAASSPASGVISLLLPRRRGVIQPETRALAENCGFWLPHWTHPQGVAVAQRRAQRFRHRRHPQRQQLPALNSWYDAWPVEVQAAVVPFRAPGVNDKPHRREDRRARAV